MTAIVSARCLVTFACTLAVIEPAKLINTIVRMMMHQVLGSIYHEAKLINGW